MQTSFTEYVALTGIPELVERSPADDVSTLFAGTSRKSILTVLSIMLIRPRPSNSGIISIRWKHSTPNCGSAITVSSTKWVRFSPVPLVVFVYLKYFWACLALLYIFLWYGPTDYENTKLAGLALSVIYSYKCNLSTDGPAIVAGINPSVSLYFKSLL